MTTIIFDTLDFADRAEKAGFTREQAEFQAREAANAIDTKIASKHDIENLRTATQNDMTILRKDIKDLENRMVIKFGVMLIAAMSAYPIISKFLSTPGVTQ